MAKHPRCKISRRLNTDIALIGRGNDIDKKCKLSTPPGQHGAKRGNRTTDYGVMLRAKQLLKNMYGMREKQFRKYYYKAARNKKATGEALLDQLESRLDNVVYRMGFAATRAEARQLVSHKHIVITNGNEEQITSKVVNIPSYLVQPGDTIEIRERSKNLSRIGEALNVAEGLGFPEWLQINVADKSGKFTRLPDRNELPAEINEQLVVEFYSK